MDLNTLLTRILKIVAVTGLIALAAFLILAEIGLNRDRPPNFHPTWHFHAGIFLVICFCSCAAYLLLGPRADPYAAVHCPRCQALGGHAIVSSYRGSVSPMAWHFGSVIFSIFYAASRKERFRCRGCDETFESHTATSSAYRILYLFMLALVVNLIWAEIAEFWSGVQ